MKAKLKVGDQGRFLIQDHAMWSGIEQNSTTEPFYVYGAIIAEDKLGYTVSSWINPNLEHDHNSEGFGLVKGAILEFVPLSKRRKL